MWNVEFWFRIKYVVFSTKHDNDFFELKKIVTTGGDQALLGSVILQVHFYEIC